MKSRLKQNLKFWKFDLSANEFICNTIGFGYIIPFTHLPPKVTLKNNRSSLNHADFVDTAISELLSSGCVKETREPYVVNPLTVSVNVSGKKRLVLDLRHVNLYVEKQKVKFEGIKEALSYAKRGLFMIKFDLKSGYHHIDIHPDYQKYLGFSWKINGITKYFEFTVLPFGLSSAGHIFTKVVRVLVQHWRSYGIPIIMYLDDGWVCENYQKCVEIAAFVRNTLSKSGFLVNEEKSQFLPLDKLTWLGFIWNLQSGTIEVPSEKLQNVRNLLISILSDKTNVSVRKLSSLVGKIISFKPAFGNICQLMTRNLCMTICCRLGWDHNIDISRQSESELVFWLNSLTNLPCSLIHKICRTPEKIIFSDASSFASAGFTCEKQQKIVHYMWDEIEQMKSSTWRELKSICIIIDSLQSFLCGKLVKVYTDNQNVVRIACKGSMNVELQQLAMQIFGICVACSIQLELEWIPRNLNYLADEYSKIFDFDDWSVADEIFRLFDARWGSFTCDIFANCKNFKVMKFYSKFWNPGTSGVDAFAYDWAGENCWIVPPPSLVCRVLSHMEICKACGTLVVPKWKSALYWPMLWDAEKGSYKSFIQDLVEYKRPKNFFRSGSDRNSIFAQEKFESNVLVLFIDFRKPNTVSASVLCE